jgi:methionyl-tRNA formyltransferase
MRVVFLGTPEFAVGPLKKLIAETEVVAVYSQPDKPVGRGLKMQASPVKQLALENNIPVFTPDKISVPEEVERLKHFAPDFIVVVAYGQILKMSVIEVPKIAIVNIHSSLLPRWRGAAPIQWAILGGDQETGVSTMMIVSKLDAGDILLQEKTPISAEDTAETVHDRLSEIGARLIVPTLRGLKDGSVPRRVQDESKVTYAHKLTKEMDQLLFTETAHAIDLKVRALNPWPGTKIEVEITVSDAAKIKPGEKLVVATTLKIKIKKGRPIENPPLRMRAGELVSSGGQLLMGCANSVYQILELQEEGKKSISGSDFLNSLGNRGLSLPLHLKLPTANHTGAKP